MIADMIDAGIAGLDLDLPAVRGDIDLSDNRRADPRDSTTRIAGPSGTDVVFVDSCAAPDGIGTLTDTAVLQGHQPPQAGLADCGGRPDLDVAGAVSLRPARGLAGQQRLAVLAEPARDLPAG